MSDVLQEVSRAVRYAGSGCAVGRRWQMFEAPGEDTPLPIGPSAWQIGSLVRVPLEHWELILGFGAGVDSTLAEALERASRGSGELDEVDEDAAQLVALIEFTARLRAEICAAPPLVPVATEEVPDEFVNEEHARMLEAFEGVVAVALRLGLPFRAWLD